ncbi:MAG TPA: patatin-like phospholipase family protein, partial [Thermodesulfobacteriota bacterium]|nr:patatin-like phospholipase family protein [Thermodesulfobacteriota bacterium]
WAGGVIQHLIEDQNKDYDLYVGTSTGSLLAPLTSIREISLLKEGYTNITSDDIFSVNPFNKKGTLNAIAIIRAITFHKTYGESKNLRNLIKKYFQEKHFDRLDKSDKEVIAVVSNMTDESVEYKSSNDYSYEEFIDWLWASCNAQTYMSILEKGDNQYADGAIYEHIPIQPAIDHGATDIDVIVLDPEGFGVVRRQRITNVFQYAFKTSRMMHKKIAKDNINLNKLHSHGRDININIYFTPYRLTENSLQFNKEEMIQWWEEGYLWAEAGNEKKYKLTRSDVFKEVE